jgi:O-antigen/teichoic acid export membrane protein
MNSYRTILKSSAIMGLASVLNIFTALVRMKAIAVLLGPAGLGLIGLYQNLMETAARLSALSIGTVGTRQVAEANTKGAVDELASARRALFWGAVALASVGGAAVFVLREPLARAVTGSVADAANIGWLALGTFLSIGAGAQSAMLNGMRRIQDIARVQVLSGLASTVLGIAAIKFWGEAAMLAVVLLAPAASFLFGSWYVSRLERIRTGPTPLAQLTARWRGMAILGFFFMLSGLVGTGGLLVVRSLIQKELGAEALGQFQAAWAIGMTYLGFVLNAMGTDYYPRLTGCIDDRVAACRLVNEQTEVALLLTAPALVALLALAPWVVRLLYTAEFGAAVHILRWQLLGDALKVMSWPLGFVIMAGGAGRTYVLTEATAFGVFALGVFLGMKTLGVFATGVAFLAMYAVYLPVVYWTARRRIGFTWTTAVLRHAAVIVATAGVVAGLGHVSDLLALAVGLPSAVGLGLFAIARLSIMAELSGPAAKFARLAQQVLKK